MKLRLALFAVGAVLGIALAGSRWLERQLTTLEKEALWI